jgi:hypothetical protein
MLRRRGRPRKPLPLHPNRVLAQAVKKGLSAAVVIQGRIKSKTTRHLHESSQEIWRKAKRKYRWSKEQKDPDFQYIMEAENNIRKNGMQILFEKAAAYGNTEIHRVRSSDDSVGPLNQRFNTGGASLREFVMTMYPFPDMKGLGPRADENGIVQMEREGYSQSSSGPEIIPTHAIPELDFIDSCRQHIQVLNTQCFIFNLSNKDTGRYANLFLLRSRPFLDCIYSEKKCGQLGFQAGTLLLLRQIKDEIAALHDTRTGDKYTVTSKWQTLEPKFETDFFEMQLKEAKAFGVAIEATNELGRILEEGSIDKDENDKPLPCLTGKDVKQIWMRCLEKSRRKGSQVHRHLLGQFHSFWDIRRAILTEEPADSDDGYLLCAEIPLETDSGVGRADLVLLHRETTPNGLRVFWRPVLVLELKTRLGFLWELNHIRKFSESRNELGLDQRVVPDFLIRTRTLDNDEWKAVIEATPRSSTENQVNLYAKAIANVYDSFTNEAVKSQIPVGTLIADAGEDLRRLRSVLRAFIIKVFESASGGGSETPRTLFELDSTSHIPKAAVIIHKQGGIKQSGRAASFPSWMPPFDPFQGGCASERRFILYLSGRSPTSDGQSAAWISRYWHGLRLLLEIAEDIEALNVIWLDLADEFTDPLLAEARLRLQPFSNSEGDQYRAQPSEIREFFESMTVIGLFQEVEAFLLRGGVKPSLDGLFDSTDAHRLVVVSGWDKIQGATPERYRPRLNRLLAALLDQIPDNKNTTVVWFNSAVPGEQGSGVYSRRTMLPFYQNSPLFGEVNEIVWNLPVAPMSEVAPEDWILPFDSVAPSYDDIRVIIHQDCKGYGIQLTQVPPLIGWSQKFHSESFRFDKESKPIETDEIVPDSNTRTRMKVLSLGLIPWLAKLHPDVTIRIEKEERAVSSILDEFASEKITSTDSIGVRSRRLGETTKTEPGLLDRLRFCPKGTRGGKTYSSLTMNVINSQRSYRSPNRLKTRQLSAYDPASRSSVSRAEVSFGQVITLNAPESHTEVLVCEDPYNPGRMLVGIFTETSQPDHLGFIWTETNPKRLEMILNSDPEDLNTLDLLFRDAEEGIECWQKDPLESKWKPRGMIEMVCGRGGRRAILSSIKETDDDLSHSRRPMIAVPSTHSARVISELGKVLEVSNASISVRVNLEETDDACRIAFIDKEDNAIVHEVEVESTPDAISLIRWPMTCRIALRTPRGEPIIWSPFDDIDYGVYDALKPLVETGASRRVGAEVAPLLADLIESQEEKSLEVVLFHDESVCPLATGAGKEHAKCWRLKPREDNQVRIDRLFHEPMTGEEVYGLLTIKRIKQGNRTHAVRLFLTPDDKDPAFCAFHEDRWIRRLLRERGRKMPWMQLGTFIAARNQKWDVDFYLDGNFVQWSAISTVTGQYWGYNTYPIERDFTLSPKEDADYVMEQIAQYIPISQILRLEQLRERLQNKLIGHGNEVPECKLSVTREGRELRVALTRVGGSDRDVILCNTFLVEESTETAELMINLRDSFLSSEFSEFNIVNEDEFFDVLEKLLDEMDDDSSEDVESMDVGF